MTPEERERAFADAALAVTLPVIGALVLRYPWLLLVEAAAVPYATWRVRR